MAKIDDKKVKKIRKNLHFSYRYSKYNKDVIVLIVFILTVAVLYGNTLKNGFIHDDHGQVEDNIYVHSIISIPKVFTTRRRINQTNDFFLAAIHKAMPFQTKLQIRIIIKTGKAIPRIADIFVNDVILLCLTRADI